MVNAFFNAELYLARNPDLAAAGLTTPDQLWTHYVNYGAQESITVPSRAPNSWFDVGFYLSSYPDLGAAGITPATALDHYYTYGLSEDRLFNPNVDLDPSNFSASNYAINNPDLVAAFGISDPANLTSAQKDTLLTHYFAFGYKEDRPGVTPSFASHVLATNQIDLDPIFAASPSPAIAYGTAADDLFLSNASTANKTINGLGGTDTVEFKASAATGAGANAVRLQNIEKVVVNGTAEFATNKLVAIQLNTGAGAVKANFDSSAISGSSDALTVNSNATATNFTVNGIENLTMALGSGVTSAVVNANSAQGSTLNMLLKGGAAAGVAVTLESASSTNLTTLNIDAAQLIGALNLAGLGTQVNNVSHVNIMGSAADVAQNFTAVAAAFAASNGVNKSLTIKGGAGVDTFAASKAIDTFEGGAGNDVYNFSAGNSLTKVASGVIAEMDTIIGFSAGDVLNGAAVQVVSGTATVPAGATLEQLVTGAQGNLASGDVFSVANTTYVLVTKDANLANVELIKLAGVDIASVDVTGGVLTVS